MKEKTVKEKGKRHEDLIGEKERLCSQQCRPVYFKQHDRPTAGSNSTRWVLLHNV